MAAKKDLDGRQQALQTAHDQIIKKFGQGSLMRLGESAKLNVDVISTGSISLDIATGVGGIPKGRVIEVFGPESSGKTTLALHMIAEAQKAGGQAAFIDAEHALDPVYARNLGVKIDELLVSQPDYGEQALEICDMLASSGALDIIVIDSVPALVPKQQIQGDMDESFVGVHARMMSKALSKIATTASQSNTCIVFINQLREKIGIMFGNPEVTPGGRAMKFYTTMRFDVRRVETIKQGDQMIGSRTRVKVVKNKVASPFKRAEFDIMYGKGISFAGDVLDCATDAGILQKSGSWYSYQGERIGQGRENVKNYLEEHKDLLDEITALLLDTLKTDDEEKKDAPAPAAKGKKADPGSVLVDEDGVIIE